MTCMRVTQALRSHSPACHLGLLRAPRTRTMAGNSDGPADPPPSLPDNIEEAIADHIGTQSGTPSKEQQKGHRDPRQDDGAAGYQQEDTSSDAASEGVDVSQRIVRDNDA